MKRPLGLRGQIILSLSGMALGIILLSVVGTYIFYGLVSKYVPGSFSDDDLPSQIEVFWLLGTVIASLSMAGFVAIRLSRRILNPLNSVAHNLREVAQGNLHARAIMDRHARGETAQLVHDFNSLAERLTNATIEQEFWNAAVAHELRTPVTILRGRLQGLAEGVFRPSDEIFEALLRQVEGLSRLIEDLRVVSLNDSGHLHMELETTDLSKDILTVAQAFDSSLKGRDIILHIQVAENEQVACDAFRIRQALMVLLENALKYAVAGELHVRFVVADDICHLVVEDSGPGIPADVAGCIFEAFRRGDPSRSRSGGGSGLGLAVVKAIAEAHGGQVTCQPSDRGGTSFILTWPKSGKPILY
ncbi:HAMP domain-containing protein [Pseudomonas protegens]|uniref:ATP-binding protein n=1 Tax=Pseudomonas protegens TaxID=380021 RepID=UPI001C8E019F|nr:ATP-binding protein [Pseudomonas protegens]QZI73551.1 HAMP domain-containing protein [Pseudomonas protegens]